MFKKVGHPDIHFQRKKVENLKQVMDLFLPQPSCVVAGKKRGEKSSSKKKISRSWSICGFFTFIHFAKSYLENLAKWIQFFR